MFVQHPNFQAGSFLWQTDHILSLVEHAWIPVCRCQQIIISPCYASCCMMTWSLLVQHAFQHSSCHAKPSCLLHFVFVTNWILTWQKMLSNFCQWFKCWASEKSLRQWHNMFCIQQVRLNSASFLSGSVLPHACHAHKHDWVQHKSCQAAYYLILVRSPNARLPILTSFAHHAVVVIRCDVGLVALPCALLCI